MRTLCLTIIAAGLTVLSACGDAGDRQPEVRPAGDGTLTVLTVNDPLAYFAGRIGGDAVDASYPGPAHEDPAYWNPPADAILAYQAADLIILNGASYAGWREKVTLPASKLVNSAAGFAHRFITLDDVVTHAHGPGGEHAHAGLTSTTWLDATLAAQQARAIADAFAAARPALADTFAANLAALERDLLALDGELATMIAGKNDRPLLASHPVYQYLARRFDLNLVSVHWEPDTVPDGRQWEELRRTLAVHPAQWMIWEGEPAAESVRRLSELGVSSLVFDPGATMPAGGDFLDLMQANLAALARAFR